MNSNNSNISSNKTLTDVQKEKLEDLAGVLDEIEGLAYYDDVFKQHIEKLGIFNIGYGQTLEDLIIILENSLKEVWIWDYTIMVQVSLMQLE